MLRYMGNKKYPPVVVVDENDNEVGSAMLDEVHQKGLYHRIVSVFIEDEYGNMLLQLRSPGVKVFPNRWDQAAGGHVDAGRSYEQAAMDEVAEELGLHGIALKTLGTHRSNIREGERTINQFERAYLVRIPHDGTPLKPQAAEVTTLRWFGPAELKAQISAHPEQFTPGLLYCLAAYFLS